MPDSISNLHIIPVDTADLAVGNTLFMAGAVEVECDASETWPEASPFTRVGLPEFYGPQATPQYRTYTESPLSDRRVLSDNYYFGSLVVASLIVYLVVLCGFRHYLGPILSLFSPGTADKVLDDQNAGLDRAVNYGCVTFFVTLGITLYALLFSGTDAQDSKFPEYLTLVIVPVFSLLGFAVSRVQKLLLKISGYLSLYGGFTDRLWRFRKFYVAGVSYVLSPIFLIYSAVLGNSSTATQLFPLGMCLLVCLYFFGRTLMLFIREKFSVFFWFLYLCGVEILPVSVLIVLWLGHAR